MGCIQRTAVTVIFSVLPNRKNEEIYLWSFVLSTPSALDLSIWVSLVFHGSKALSPSFFFGTENGTVSYADDLGHCSEVQQLTSAVDGLVFYEAVRRLVIITRSLLMTQLQASERVHCLAVLVEYCDIQNEEHVFGFFCR